jgi:flagellar secretion chaperone FliS
MDARSSYREAATRGAKPLQLVILLYEQSIEDLRRALAALHKGDIETRTRQINHALVVIGHLQGSLDMEQGAQVARNLDLFYQVTRDALVNAHKKQSATILQEQIAHLMLLREAWIEVERATSPSSGVSAERGPAVETRLGEPKKPTEWSA